MIQTFCDTPPLNSKKALQTNYYLQRFLCLFKNLSHIIRKRGGEGQRFSGDWMSE